MRINIVTEASPGWVLRKISETVKGYMPDTYITEYAPDGKGDINLYINYALFKHKTNKIDVGWFTHKESDGKFDKIAKEVDYCIAMSNKTGKLLPSNKTTVIEPCADFQFYKDKLVLGCVGRTYPSGRKKFNLIEDIESIEGVEVRVTNGKVVWDKMSDFYKGIDYLLILSTNEGGPMPVLEAIAYGKPVIAPDVGWCWEYPVIRYNSIDELKKIINKLIYPKDCWKVSTMKTYNLCKELYEYNSKS